jgi:hypothetical protein
MAGDNGYSGCHSCCGPDKIPPADGWFVHDRFKIYLNVGKIPEINFLID